MNLPIRPDPSALPDAAWRAPLTPPAPPAPPAPLPSDRIFRRALSGAMVSILLCFGAVGGWLYVARLDSAVVAQGVLENANVTRTIQHLEGGIVREIHVRNGDRVQAGDLLLRLDRTEGMATTALFSTQILDSRTRQERFEAELAMADDLVFSPDLLAGIEAWPQLHRVPGDEVHRFRLLRQELVQAREILQTKIAQADEEIRANEVRRAIAEREAALVNADLADVRSLRERGLTNQARVTALEQSSLGLEEKIAQADIDIARIRQAVLGFRLEITQREQEYRARAAQGLEDVKREIRELERNVTVARDSLERVEIRAPVDGTVQESILGTVGAVIRGGETILRIAPAESDYIIVARISPNDIDGLLPGNQAMITLPAFQTLDLSPAKGELLSLSRDRVVDPMNNQDYYYEARIRLDETTLPELPRQRLVAGMSATTILPIGERSALAYLTGPLSRRLQAAMREE